VRLACATTLGGGGSPGGGEGREGAAGKAERGDAVVCGARLLAQVVQGQAAATGFHLLCPLLLLRRMPGERAAAAAAAAGGGGGAGAEGGGASAWHVPRATRTAAGGLPPRLAANTVAHVAGALWRRLR
jgi:hypothetical protein